MSTSYSRAGLKQVCATLLGARHVPDASDASAVALSTWLCYNEFLLFLPFLPLRHQATNTKT